MEYIWSKELWTCKVMDPEIEPEVTVKLFSPASLQDTQKIKVPVSVTVKLLVVYISPLDDEIVAVTGKSNMPPP